MTENTKSCLTETGGGINQKDPPTKSFIQIYLMVQLLRKSFPEILFFREGARFLWFV